MYKSSLQWLSGIIYCTWNNIIKSTLHVKSNFIDDEQIQKEAMIHIDGHMK